MERRDVTSLGVRHPEHADLRFNALFDGTAVFLSRAGLAMVGNVLPKKPLPELRMVGALAAGRFQANGSLPARASDMISAALVRAWAGVTGPWGPMVTFTDRPR